MADVQPEHGYTKIADEILEQMARIKLSPTQYRILFVVWRYTYGFNRKEHQLTLGFISNATGCDKRQLQRELKGLESRKIIFQSVVNGKGRKIKFNKDYDDWINPTIGETTIGEIDNGETVIGEIVKGTIGETDKGTLGEIDNQEIHYLKTTLKTDSRRKYSDDSPPYKMALYLLSKIREWTDRINEPNMQKWSDDCRKILDIDKRDKALIRNVIDWATKDDFWQANILSPASLRKQFLKLCIQMEKENKQPIKGKFDKNKSLLQKKMQEALHEEDRDNQTSLFDFNSLS